MGSRESEILRSAGDDGNVRPAFLFLSIPYFSVLFLYEVASAEDRVIRLK